MTSTEVKYECEILATAVNVIMDPKSTLPQRAEAQKFCDAFKANSPLCITCGLMLVEKKEPTIVRHLGIQILEHLVKRRWGTTPQKERIFLKERVMHLISTGLKPGLEEEVCIKNGYACIMVEIIKKERFKNWPKQLLELQTLLSKGALQAELVMLILLRVSEDVAIFETQFFVRKETHKQMLKGSMQKILYTVRHLLKDYTKTYRVLKNDAKYQSQAKTCCRVIVAALNTMESYLEWAPLKHITNGQTKLMETLLCLMNDAELQLEASQALLTAVKRMSVNVTTCGKPLLVLIEDSSTPYIFSSAQLAAGEVLTDEHYFLMKIRCELLSALGEQLCHVMNKDGCVEPPHNFGKYLDCLLDFTSLSSKYLSSLTHPTWLMLFKHKQLSRNPCILALLPKYLLATRTNLVKVGFPSKNSHPSCEYSRLDFASDEDFYEFLTTYRTELKQVIDAVCRIDQRKCFQVVSKCLKHHLLPSIKSEVVVECASDGLTCTDMRSFPQWEATTFFTKIITANLFQNLENTDIPVQDGIELLQLALDFRTKNPHFLACIQTNISTLFPFVYFKTELVPHVLNKLLEIIEELKVPKEPSLTDFRRNSYSCINQICRNHARVILPNFGILFDYVKQLLRDEMLQLTQMEKNTLMEAMFVVIKQLKHYDEQKALLEELMAPILSHWQSAELQRAFSDSESFIKYVGADQHATFATAEKDLNRSRIIYCVSAILEVLRWIRCPIVMKTDEFGGFVIGCTPTGNQILRNPCSELVLKFLDNLFILIRTQNNIYLPKLVMKLRAISKEGSPLDLPKVKSTWTKDFPQTLRYIDDPPEYKTHLEKLQGFFCSLYNCCFYILGHIGPSLKQDFYSMKNLVDRILQCAFVNLRLIPDFRILTVVHCFLNPMAISCPPDYYENVLTPILHCCFSSLHTRLSNEWNIIKKLNMPMRHRRHMEQKQKKTGSVCSTERPVPENPRRPIFVPYHFQQLSKEVIQFLSAQTMAGVTFADSGNDEAQRTDAGTIVDGAQSTDAVTIVDVKDDGRQVSLLSSPQVANKRRGEQKNKPLSGHQVSSLSSPQVASERRAEQKNKPLSGRRVSSLSSPQVANERRGDQKNKPLSGVVCDYNEDADDMICAAESDDDNCVCISDNISSSAGDCYKAGDKAETSAAVEQCDASCSIPNKNADSLAQSEASCSIPNTNADSLAQSDASCSIPNTNADSLAQSDDACIMSMEDTDDSVMVAVESDEDAEGNEDAEDSESSEDAKGGENAEEDDDEEGVEDPEGGEDAGGVDPEGGEDAGGVDAEGGEDAEGSEPTEADEGEMAAEIAVEMHPPAQHMPSRCTLFTEHIKLTKLGICLLKNENVRLTLLRLAFDSLVWNVQPCQKTVTHLCWPMLKQVIFEALPVESVTNYFTTVLEVLHKRRRARDSYRDLERLAFQMYLSLRPRYSKLADVMRTVLHVREHYLKEFDQKLLNPTIKEPDHILVDNFKRMCENCIEVEVSTESGVQVQGITATQPFKRARKRPRPQNVQSKNLEEPPKKKKKKKKNRAAFRFWRNFKKGQKQPAMPTSFVSSQFQE